MQRCRRGRRSHGGSGGKVTLKLVPRGSAGSPCVEMGGEGLPSKGLQGVEKRQKPLKEEAVRSGAPGDSGGQSFLGSKALGFPTCLNVGNLEKCWSLFHMETRAHMNPCRRNSGRVKIRGRAPGSQPCPCTHLHCALPEPRPLGNQGIGPSQHYILSLFQEPRLPLPKKGFLF